MTADDIERVARVAAAKALEDVARELLVLSQALHETAVAQTLALIDDAEERGVSSRGVSRVASRGVTRVARVSPRVSRRRT